MFKKSYLLVLTIFVLFNVSFAQSFLTHNTGVLQVSVFDNGYIGHNFDATSGNGVKFGTAPDAMFTAGLIFGNLSNGVNGMVGSFVSGTPQAPIIADMQNTSALTPFSNDPNFNEITEAVMNDGLSPTPYNISVKQKSYSNTNDKFVFITYNLTNNSTQPIPNFRVGIFSDWDVGATAYLSNRRGIDVSRNLVYQYLVGTADPNYYGFVALNGLTGGTSTDFFPGDNNTIRFEVYNLINVIFDSTNITTVGDYRSYAGSGPYTFDAGTSLFVSFAVVVGTSLADLQASADAAILKYNNTIVPVELTSFTAKSSSGQVTLNWSTASELNNMGFEIQRKSTVGENSSDWTKIAFTEGRGTTSENQNYIYVDNVRDLSADAVTYRLKQIDYNGTFEYSPEVLVDNLVPLEFGLSQNYPNPFNPSTVIKYQMPNDNFVSLKVFNTLGQEVATLVNGFVTAGAHEVNFNAVNLTSGVYYYILRVSEVNGSEQVFTNKMMLMK